MGFEIVRTFGDPIVVERVLARPAEGGARVIPIEPTALVTGSRLRLVI